jgi:hypothetical protein
MDSLNRIFQCIHEAKKGGKAMIPKHHEKAGGKKSPKGEENPYDSGSFGMKAESSHMGKKKNKKLTGNPHKKLIGNQHKLDQDEDGILTTRDFKMLRGESSEIVTVLSILKEAYQDELISEEAFLAIADPIMRSLMNEVKYEGTPEEGVVTAGSKGRTRKVTGPKAAGVYKAAKRRVSGEFGPEAANPPKGSKLYYGKK